jgi:hypothetical protein
MWSMDCKKALKSGTIAVALLVAAISITQQQAQASGTFDNGYKQGESDARAGDGRNNTCPPSYDHGACILYEQGYNLGYSAEKSIHDDDRPRNYNFDENDGGSSGTREDDGEFQNNDDDN